KDYFLKFFSDGMQEGSLVLDLETHPLLISDYRIKVFSTHPLHAPPQFLPAIDTVLPDNVQHLTTSNATLSIPPGYYLLKPSGAEPNGSISVRNLKLNETILQTKEIPSGNSENASGFAFAILPVREIFRFSLLPKFHMEPLPNQLVQFNWNGIQ